MKAMVLKKLSRLEENPTPLELQTLPDPIPKERELLLKVSACGVCHTELDEIEGRTPPSQLPMMLSTRAGSCIVASRRRASA
jgi:alcohol dehydrogenase, propanol-preferring